MKRFFGLSKIAMRHSLLVGAFFVLGCASYQKNVESSRDYMQSGNFEAAEEKLKKLVDESKGDKLAYLLEYATVLHQAKRYKESNVAFAQAEKEAQINDYTSLSREFGSVLLQEGILQFRVETFEYLLINVYQALNYIMLDDYENAQVMARKINEKINKLEVDEDSRRRQSGFATYLAGIMWESQGDWDNAFVLYNKAYQFLPEVETLQEDLVRAAKMSRRELDMEKLQKKLPEVYKRINVGEYKSKGEFILIYQQGWIPHKAPRFDNHRFPMMVPVNSSMRYVKLKDEKGLIQETETALNLEKVSVQTLNDDYTRLVAKKVVGVVAKAVIADQINRRQQGLGTLAFLALDAMDQADLRQWSTLPATFQIARLPLNPGKHTVSIMPENGDSPIWSGEVEIKKGKKHFFTFRTF